MFLRRTSLLMMRRSWQCDFPCQLKVPFLNYLRYFACPTRPSDCLDNDSEQMNLEKRIQKTGRKKVFDTIVKSFDLVDEKSERSFYKKTNFFKINHPANL